MKTSRRLLYLASFTALAVTAALVTNRVGQPSIAPLLLLATVAGIAAGAPGLVHKRAWPLALVLVPLGAYLLLRLQLPVPSHVHGAGGQLSFYLSHLRGAVDAGERDGFPLDFGLVDVRLLLSLAVYLTVGAAAVLALSLRLTLPAIVLLLVLLGFAFTTDGTTAAVWPALASLLLAGCLLALSRSLRREHWRATDALAGAGMAMAAAVLALSLLGATSVAASKPWQDWRSWDIGGVASTHLGFNWMVDYPRLLDKASNATVMRVKSPVASYWRANALDFFTGTTWANRVPAGEQLQPETSTSGAYTYVVPYHYPEPPGKVVTESFSVQSTYTDYLFAGGSPRALVIGRQIRLRTNDVRGLAVDPPLGPSLSYTVTATIPQLKPSDLVGQGRDYPEAIVRRYAELPFPKLSQLDSEAPEEAWQRAMSKNEATLEWLGLYELNRAIVGSSTDPYEIALKVEEFLRSHYSYSLTPPLSDYKSPYAAFLFRTDTGYCQHFAGAMAAILRFNGIPARVAVGFTAGKRAKDGTFVVTRRDAHAWVEAYFPRTGWVTFDPTPGRSVPGHGVSSTSTGFIDPFIVGGTASTPSVTQTTPARGRPTGPGADASSGDTGAGTTSTGAPDLLTWGVVLAGLLVAWPAVRAAVRRRRLHRGDPNARLRAAVAAIYGVLRDYGITVSPSQTLDETARFLESYLGLDATALAARVQAVVFGRRTATAEDLAAAAVLIRELKRRMRARKGRLRALVALYGVSAISAWRPADQEATIALP